MQLLKKAMCGSNMENDVSESRGFDKHANDFIVGALGLIWPGICANETPEESYTFSDLVKGDCRYRLQNPYIPCKQK